MQVLQHLSDFEVWYGVRKCFKVDPRTSGKTQVLTTIIFSDHRGCHAFMYFEGAIGVALGLLMALGSFILPPSISVILSITIDVSQFGGIQWYTLVSCVLFCGIIVCLWPLKIGYKQIYSYYDTAE